MSTARPIDDLSAMQRALVLAAGGEGLVEPNPMVGCVVVRKGRIVGEGYHEQCGGPHAEVNALAAAGNAARGATAFVTLEPCCHAGKTPPCVAALLAAGIRRVVVACRDPFPQVDGGGIRALQAAGVSCEVGLMEAEARRLMAPYLKITTTGRPWVVAKWAMTLDGRIATRTGDSKWISSEASRGRVHELRGRVDAILVGAGTLVADDPLLNARPPGPRTPLRVVLAGNLPLPLDRKLWTSAEEGPVLVAIGPNYPADDATRLADLGVQVVTQSAAELLDELGRRRLTNVLFEGGGKLLGRLFDEQLIDEIWAFVAPKIVGGDSPGPVSGAGQELMSEAFRLSDVNHESIGEDILIRGRLDTQSDRTQNRGQ